MSGPEMLNKMGDSNSPEEKVFNVRLSSHIWLFRLVSSQLIAARFLDQRQRVSFRPGPVFSTAALNAEPATGAEWNHESRGQCGIHLSHQHYLTGVYEQNGATLMYVLEMGQG
ncbi:hypothetical protein EYF80_009635 [Liparis tanakae]|uniref:Uncharacterized protein n=1 Tax=Liparis tanakae TaxID=230148 RepID=A0A4Z2IRH4_9TELE|nr:hypothetical protein EYF80_009635 [Liparis tanakae]